mmetsp:Transcript_13756/g.27827  ORF Transcript_13756/g.27827 Transcript_13756/m.27827 type:complete len:783 (-) Transcript_13756:90-2438(-)
MARAAFLALSLGCALAAWTGKPLAPAHRPHSLSERMYVANEAVASADAGLVDVCIFSNRVEGLTGTLLSTAIHAKNPENIRVWVVTDNLEAIETVMQNVKHTGIQVEPLDLKAVEKDLEASGFVPVWNWGEYSSSILNEDYDYNPQWLGDKSAVPGSWDRSSMHMNPLNHLRFYIPHMSQFRDLDRIIFMDDDLIVQGDLRAAWDARENMGKGKVIAAACEVWKFDQTFGGFAYLGNTAKLSSASALSQDSEVCPKVNGTGDMDMSLPYACVGSEFKANLLKRAREINGKQFEPEKETDWNFGFTLLDLKEWRENNMTEVYEQWMHANYEDHIFPESSLMYGLGIPFLAFYQRISCWDQLTSPPMSVRDGFGFITWSDFEWNQMGGDFLADGFVLHYDGFHKPWLAGADPVLAIPYQQVMKGQTVHEYQKLLRDPAYLRSVQTPAVRSPFLVLGDQRSGGEWLISMLDENSQVCAGKHLQDSNLADTKQAHEAPWNLLAPSTGSREIQQYQRAGCYWWFVRDWAPVAHAKGWCDQRDQKDNLKLGGQARGVKDHLDYLCTYQAHADPQELFTEFLGRVLSGDPSMSTCRCAVESTAAGALVRTEWIGHQFQGGNLNFDGNELDDRNTTESPSDSAVSLWKALADLRPRPKILHVRRDVFDEAVSRQVATQTRVVHAQSAEEVQKVRGMSLSLDEKKVEKETTMRTSHRLYIEERLAELDNEVLHVEYEDCAGDPKKCVARMEQFLEVEPEEHNYDLSLKILGPNVANKVVKDFAHLKKMYKK